MKYINLHPLTAEQIVEKAEKAWQHYDAYFSPINPTEVKMDHDAYVADRIALHYTIEAQMKLDVESITIFDEIIETATPEELTYCLGSKVRARIRSAHDAAMVAAREAGDTKLIEALGHAEGYALSVVRHLAMGKTIPEQADDATPETSERETQADADTYPPEVIALAGQIAEDVLAADDDGIATVDHKAIAADIMRMGAAAAVAKYIRTRKSAQ